MNLSAAFAYVEIVQVGVRKLGGGVPSHLNRLFVALSILIRGTFGVAAKGHWDEAFVLLYEKESFCLAHPRSVGVCMREERLRWRGVYRLLVFGAPPAARVTP